jgi:hypothetical protein
MVYGEVMQRWRMASGVALRKWPKEELERWGGWFLFGLFAAILVRGGGTAGWAWVAGHNWLRSVQLQ